MRYLVVGVTGSGKTTTARAIAARLGIPHIELDELFWGPNWQERPLEEFRAGVETAIRKSDTWVACGNYHSKLHDLTWRNADVVVWLDMPKPISLGRLVRRTFTRVATREPLWSGNRESIRNTFFHRESLLVWWWKTQKDEPARTLERLGSAPRAKVVRIRSPREQNEWLRSLV